jgi:hypothetical protein
LLRQSCFKSETASRTKAYELAYPALNEALLLWMFLHINNEGRGEKVVEPEVAKKRGA